MKVAIGVAGAAFPSPVDAKVQLVLKNYLRLRVKCDRHANTMDDIFKMVHDHHLSIFLYRKIIAFNSGRKNAVFS